MANDDSRFSLDPNEFHEIGGYLMTADEAVAMLVRLLGDENLTEGEKDILAVVEQSGRPSISKVDILAVLTRRGLRGDGTESYLGKTLAHLVHRGLLVSKRGRGGGYSLPDQTYKL